MKNDSGYFSSVWPYPVKNGHQKRIFSKNVFQGGDFSKRRGFAVLVTYGWKKTEVIEKRLRHSTLRAGGFSLAWLLAFTMSFPPLASRVVGLLSTPDARDKHLLAGYVTVLDINKCPCSHQRWHRFQSPVRFRVDGKNDSKT